MDVSEQGNYRHDYQYFYTGAFMSWGYPAKKRESYGVGYYMYFGGLPPNTYTTMSLHSSPSLLANMSLNMYPVTWKQRKGWFPGFSTELPHTPISVFTEEGYAVEASCLCSSLNVNADSLYPAFLFSFKGQCSSHYNSS